MGRGVEERRERGEGRVGDEGRGEEREGRGGLGRTVEERREKGRALFHMLRCKVMINTDAIFSFLLFLCHLLDGRGNNQMRYRRIDVELLNKEMSEFTVVRHTEDIMAKKYFMGMKI